MKNYKLTIQYDGTNYAGWQIQIDVPTVQQKISDAIKILLKEDINLIGSGRTDAGVHALGQVANFRTQDEININRFKHSLNAILPHDISITNIEEVNPDFHARFSAVKRSYLYLISTSKSPFYEKYSFCTHRNLNVDKLNILAEVFIGKNDFTSFCRKNSENENKECSVYSAHWKETKGLFIFFIEANRFLHGMVRTIVGTMLKAMGNDMDSEYLKNIFNEKNRADAGEAITPKGLFLYKVKY